MVFFTLSFRYKFTIRGEKIYDETGIIHYRAIGLILQGVCAADDKVKLTDEKAKISYSAGYRLGSDFKQQFGGVDAKAMVKGVQDALIGADPLMSPEEMQATLMELKKQVVAQKQLERQQLAAKHLTEGRDFLAENAKKDGVVSLQSGRHQGGLRQSPGP